MQTNYRYVTDDCEYASLRALVMSRISTGVALPELIFRKARNIYAFIEFDLLLSGAFWEKVPLINQTAGLRADSEVVIFMLDPERTSARGHSEHGYGMFIAKSTLTPAQYEAAASQSLSDKQFDCMNIVANRLVLCSREVGWVLWGCRQLEVGILSHPRLEARDLGRDWVSAVAALEFYGLKKRIEADDGYSFRQTFLANYSAS